MLHVHSQFCQWNTECTLCHPYGSGPDSYLEICLEVNLNFQVLTNGIFPPPREYSIPGSWLLTFNNNILSLLQFFAELDLYKSLLNSSLSFFFLLKIVFGFLTLNLTSIA